MNTTAYIVFALILMWAIGLVIGASLLNGYWRRQFVRALQRMKGEQVTVPPFVMDWLGEVQNVVQREVDRRAATQAAQAPSNQLAYIKAKEDTDAIALFLREHYASEIEKGYHAGRSLGMVVTGYLSREREYERSKTERGVPTR